MTKMQIDNDTADMAVNIDNHTPMMRQYFCVKCILLI